MYAQTLIIALMSMLNVLALASPLTTNVKRDDDFVTCLNICSGENKLCLNTAANNTTEVAGVAYSW